MREYDRVVLKKRVVFTERRTGKELSFTTEKQTVYISKEVKDDDLAKELNDCYSILKNSTCYNTDLETDKKMFSQGPELIRTTEGNVLRYKDYELIASLPYIRFYQEDEYDTDYGKDIGNIKEVARYSSELSIGSIPTYTNTKKT